MNCHLRSLFLIVFNCTALFAISQEVPIWDKYEISFKSTVELENPIYELKGFSGMFISPTGR
ncbi:MAG: hypothetical protein KDC53_12975, partial [Saprospiraceae bacterium]|nr:hypothetical protein [Saprospiraceae bacterium]